MKNTCNNTDCLPFYLVTFSVKLAVKCEDKEVAKIAETHFVSHSVCDNETPEFPQLQLQISIAVGDLERSASF